jgi:hypothetical protein
MRQVEHHLWGQTLQRRSIPKKNSVQIISGTDNMIDPTETPARRKGNWWVKSGSKPPVIRTATADNEISPALVEYETPGSQRTQKSKVKFTRSFQLQQHPQLNPEKLGEIQKTRPDEDWLDDEGENSPEKRTTGLKHSGSEDQLSWRNQIAALVCFYVFGAIFGTYGMGWSIWESLYFATVTATTVGYGDYTPETDVQKLWTCALIIFAIMVVGSVIGSGRRE